MHWYIKYLQKLSFLFNLFNFKFTFKFFISQHNENRERETVEAKRNANGLKKSQQE